MKHKYTVNVFVLAFFFTFIGCQPVIDVPASTSGDLDFSSYLAVGSSLTAGLNNRDVFGVGEQPEGGLYAKGQMNSFPAIFARQLNKVNPVPFSQPMVDHNGSSFARLDGFRPTCENFAPTPRMSMSPLTTGWSSPVTGQGPFNNMGIPQLRMADIHEPGMYNPYMSRVIGDSASYFDAIQKMKPTFFTLWMGLEDIFQYAYLGGKGRPIPEAATYETHLRALLEVLLQDEKTSGMIANIPDITQMPFFRSVKDLAHDYDCQPLQLWVETCSTDIIQARETDLVLLTCFDEVLGQIGSGWGSSEIKAIPNKYILDEQEVIHVRAMIHAYNRVISSVVNDFNSGKKRIALVDTYTLFNQIYKGEIVNGIPVNATYIYGHFYSLDGIFPTARGNALIADYFINALNESFPNVSIPRVEDVNLYPGVAFP